MPMESKAIRTRRSPQAQLDTRAIEIASAADAKVEAATMNFTKHIDLLRDDIKDGRVERAEQHKEAEAKFTSIQRAMWSAAISLILLLAGWIFYLATHQRI